MLVVYATLATYGGWRALNENTAALRKGYATEAAEKNLEAAQSYTGRSTPVYEREKSDGQTVFCKFFCL